MITEDRYILTMFHAYNEQHRDPSKGPIMFQHGAGGNGSMWLRNDNVKKLAEMGHDIYLGNARGTEYS